MSLPLCTTLCSIGRIGPRSRLPLTSPSWTARQVSCICTWVQHEVLCKQLRLLADLQGSASQQKGMSSFCHHFVQPCHVHGTLLSEMKEALCIQSPKGWSLSAQNDGIAMQARLDKEDLRIELSVAALRKQTQKAVRRAADLEVTLGEYILQFWLLIGLHHISPRVKKMFVNNKSMLNIFMVPIKSKPPSTAQSHLLCCTLNSCKSLALDVEHQAMICHKYLT